MSNTASPILADYSSPEISAFMRHLCQVYLASEGFHQLSPYIRERNARMVVDLLEEVRG